MKKKVLFIDRDGTIIVEPPATFQINHLKQLEFLPGVIRNLYLIQKHLDFEMVMVSNQDGLGTEAYPQENFDLVQDKILRIFRNEDILFDQIFIDKSLPSENLPTRKPGTAMLSQYFSEEYDLKRSYVIGDRLTDIELAKNLGSRAILFSDTTHFIPNVDLITVDWNKISEFLLSGERKASVKRITKETNVHIEMNLDGKGQTDIATGIRFFDHLLAQIGKHAEMNLMIQVNGDLEIDDHHTIEDTSIAFGEALLQAIADKRGIERYGFHLPMDDCLCSVALDFGGRSWLVWDVEFQREKVGDMPTEMFFHFFKSLSDSAKINLNIKAEGKNEHHKIEGIFKAFARSIKMAKQRNIFNNDLPSTKGMI